MDGMAQGVPRVLHDLVMAGISRAGSQHHVRNHLELERQKGDSWEIHTTCQHCHHQFPTSFQLQCHIESVHASWQPSTVCNICELSFKTDQVLLQHMKNSHTPGKMPYVCRVCNDRWLAMQRHILEHERFALSFLPRNFLTGDILCKSCLEALEQEGFSMFHVLATVFEPEGKDREPNQESSIIQKARAIARVAS